MLNRQELLEWIKYNKGKTIALLIACFYLIVGLFGGVYGVIIVLLWLIIPLALIFFSDVIGGSTSTSLIRPLGTFFGGVNPTLRCFIALAGWLLLLYPVVLGIVEAVSK